MHLSNLENRTTLTLQIFIVVKKYDEIKVKSEPHLKPKTLEKNKFSVVISMVLTCNLIAEFKLFLSQKHGIIC